MTDETKPKATPPTPATALLSAPPRIVNIGLEGFADDLAKAGAEVVHVSWRPPARGDARLAALLGKLGS